jgi:hypothetical protein
MDLGKVAHFPSRIFLNRPIVKIEEFEKSGMCIWEPTFDDDGPKHTAVAVVRPNSNRNHRASITPQYCSK